LFVLENRRVVAAISDSGLCGGRVSESDDSSVTIGIHNHSLSITPDEIISFFDCVLGDPWHRCRARRAHRAAGPQANLEVLLREIAAERPAPPFALQLVIIMQISSPKNSPSRLLAVTKANLRCR